MKCNVINNTDFFGYFGDASDHLPHSDSGRITEFELLGEKIQCGVNQAPVSLFFLKQTHSADVIVLRETLKNNIFFKQKGDSIITNQTNVGIGVITADCVPLILFDPINKAIGVIHAGWKGLSQKIITETVRGLQKNFSTDAQQLKVYIGPAAGACCYEVQNDFLKYFSQSIFENKIAEYRDKKIFFNSKAMAVSELLENDISLNNINLDYYACTICNKQYCSFRRDKDKSGRQASVMVLRGRGC